MNTVKTQTAGKASFYFRDYRFVKSAIDYTLISNASDLSIKFLPSGVYSANNGEYKLNLIFLAKDNNCKKEIINIECVAIFEFADIVPFEELPDYFFTNSTAILYPYIRSFVSTLTLQSNYESFLLPTLNVSSLGIELKANTTLIDK